MRLEWLNRKRDRESHMNKADPGSTTEGIWRGEGNPRGLLGSCPPRQGCGVDRSQHVPSRDQEETDCSKPHSGVTNSIYQVSITDLGYRLFQLDLSPRLSPLHIHLFP